MQHRNIARARRIVGVIAGSVLAISVVSPAEARDHENDSDGSVQVVVDGLDNPRGIAFSADGKLYVAEAGHGGDVCFPSESTETGGPLCIGLSGRFSRVNVWAGTVTPIIDGLISADGPPFAIGPTGVAVQGNQVFGLLGANGVGAPPDEACAGATDPGGNPLADLSACTEALAAGRAELGRLLRIWHQGAFTSKADVGGFNYQWTVDNKDTIPLPGWSDNPDFQPGDANPYGLAAGRGGLYVVDGGANTLSKIRSNFTQKVIAAFPNPEDPTVANAYDAVPTCVTQVGKRMLVADLNGRIFLVDGSTMYPTPIATTGDGFLVAAGGCAGDGRGNVYISDIFAGNVVKLSLRTNRLSIVAQGLNYPTGVAISPRGQVYVANNGVCPAFPFPDPPCPGTGQIVRLDD